MGAKHGVPQDSALPTVITLTRRAEVVGMSTLSDLGLRFLMFDV